MDLLRERAQSATARLVIVGDEQEVLYLAVVQPDGQTVIGWYPGWHGGVPPAKLEGRLMARFLGSKRAGEPLKDVKAAVRLARAVPQGRFPIQEERARFIASHLSSLWAVPVGIETVSKPGTVARLSAPSAFYPHYWSTE